MVQPCLQGTTLFRTQRYLAPRAFCRNKSITAAIERGRLGFGDRQAPNSKNRVKYEVTNSGRVQPLSPRPRYSPPTAEHRTITRRAWEEKRVEERVKPTASKPRYSPPVAGHRTVSRRAFEERQTEARIEREDGAAQRNRKAPIPESLPYSSAASEFLYGYSSVVAAIKAGRRKFYKLYIHTRGRNHPGQDALVARARGLKIDIQEVGDEYLRALDKASSGRPHNGFVLESSPLPVPPIAELRSSSIPSEHFHVTVDKQSAEDFLVNGKREKYRYKSAGWRHPLVLYVDGVLDEGNLGATARSAYFLGVDAIVTPTRQSAPWSHIALKASAGAAEAIPIFKVSQSSEFLGRSAREGWRIYASDAIPSAEHPNPASSSSNQSVADFSSNIIYTYARSSRRLPAEHCPVESHPTILMMGAEGTGLRNGLLNQAHYKVGIRHGREVDEVGVDSLNVSVAASLLCYEILKKPKTTRKLGDRLF